MDAALLVGDAQVSVVAASRASRVGEDQHPLTASHEGVRLGLGSRRTPALDDTATLPVDNPTTAASDLSHLFGAKRLQHGVQDAWDGREAG